MAISPNINDLEKEKFVESEQVPGQPAVVVTNPDGSSLGQLGVTPSQVQKASSSSTGSVASLALAFTTNNKSGNSIVVVCAVGNGTAPTVADSNGNTYKQAVVEPNSTTFGTAIFIAVGIKGGANTVTVTNAGATASMAMTIYEYSGFLQQLTAQPDQTETNTGSSGTASTSAISATTPNEVAFAAVAVGTAAQTITPASGWTNDSGQQNPTTPAGLFSFISMSQYLGSTSAVTPSATFTSEPWAIAVATFRSIVLGVEGNLSATFSGALPAGTNNIGKVDAELYDSQGNALATNAVSGVASQATGGTDTAVIAAQGSGNFIYITSISVKNTGATPSLVTIETDTTSAKTAIWYMIAPAGGGDNVVFPGVGLKTPVSNKNLGFNPTSSSSTIYVSIAGYFGL